MARHDPSGTIAFHYPEYDEVYALESATLQATREDDGSWALCFNINAKKEPLKPRPNNDGYSVKPNAEVSVFVAEFDPGKLVGRRFEVPRSYDEDRADHVSCVYYYEHSDFNRIVVEIVDRRANRFRVRWTGTQSDAEEDTDNVAPTQIEIDGWFEFLGGEGE